MAKTKIDDRYLHRILSKVQKPGRYTGGELNQVVKDWSTIKTRIALIFPDIYDLGMSNLGLMILYDTLNKRSDILAERVFSPWTDMESELRKHDLPLFSLESRRTLADFDILGYSLPYETLYTNLLNTLDLGKLPLLSLNRTEKHPLIIAGGHATFNPEPVADFIDAFVIGEGEEVIHEIVDVYKHWKSDGESRQQLLLTLSKLWGVYVPSLYKPVYSSDYTIEKIELLHPEAPLPITKRIVPKLPPPVTRFIVPNIDIVHNRAPIEIMRGCTRGCRFCHAGMVTRPVRERSVDEVLESVEKILRNTGFEEIGLLSLSSSDYTHVIELVTKISEKYSDQHLSISLPSLRIESVSVDLMDALKKGRRGGFTLAPEAATQHMREIINKPVSSDQLLDTTREIYKRGWNTIKLYFMIGHPSETIEDVAAIADLCKSVLKVGRQEIGHRAKVNIGVSTFVPKPHTPFQWVPCDDEETIIMKQELLSKQLRRKGLKLNWNNPKATMLEAWLSRGDRRLGAVILEAWRNGAKFDAWREHFNYQIWSDAFNSCNIDPAFYSHRERALDEVFPWEHISTSIRRQFLELDYQKSIKAETREDCRDNCFACGVLPTFADHRREITGPHWQCPEVSPKRSKQLIPAENILAVTN